MAATPSEAAERDARHPSPIIKQGSLTQCPDAHWGINAAASTAAVMPPTFQRTLDAIYSALAHGRSFQN